jgi:hypothetical protein
MAMENNYVAEARVKKKKMNKALRWVYLVFGGLVALALIAIVVKMFIGDQSEIYNMVALAIIVLWFGILIAYYAWAIYFYNINLGLTDEDWAEIRERKQFQPEGVDEPTENPNINQTLGLPTGTVRGTVALTLLIGGVAMTIAALGMESTVDANSFLVDNFEFFKTAFLMMIAFYFGNKSLEMLGYKSKKEKPGEKDAEGQKTAVGDTDELLPVAREAGAVKTLLKKVPSAKDDKKDDTKPAGDFENPDAIG